MAQSAGPRGDVVKWFNTEVCKTSIHRFESGRRLHPSPIRSGLAGLLRVELRDGVPLFWRPKWSLSGVPERRPWRTDGALREVVDNLAAMPRDDVIDNRASMRSEPSS